MFHSTTTVFFFYNTATTGVDPLSVPKQHTRHTKKKKKKKKKSEKIIVEGEIQSAGPCFHQFNAKKIVPVCFDVEKTAGKAAG